MSLPFTLLLEYVYSARALRLQELEQGVRAQITALTRWEPEREEEPAGQLDGSRAREAKREPLIKTKWLPTSAGRSSLKHYELKVPSSATRW